MARAMLSDEGCVRYKRCPSRRLSTPSLSKFKKKRWSLLALLTLLLFILVIIDYTTCAVTVLQKENSNSTVNNTTFPSTVWCYSETEGDALASADDLISPENSIFFHETSCAGGLNSRQACSVEAAAKSHPNRTVYVLFNSPVTDNTLKASSLATLTQLPNVRLLRLNIRTYGKGTPLADVLVEAQFNERSWMLEHTSDLLRFVTLYKYGGIYLDLDMLIVRNLDDLGWSWVGREDHITVNAAAISFNKNDIGKEMAEIIVNDLEWNFQPLRWAHNGPGAINRAVLSICTVGLEIVPTSEGDFTCQDFTVYNPNYFYPIHYNQSASYFDSKTPFREVPEAYGYHMWNKMTSGTQVMPGSPYDVLAKKYCPSVRYMYGDKFGS